MTIAEQIKEYISSLPEARRADMQVLHEYLLQVMPGALLWFLDGRNKEGKVVSNPNIGYGNQIMNYADGSKREFYQVGLSATTSGISVYIMGIKDKKYLADTFAARIGKADVTAYCIKFKTLRNIDISVLKEAVRLGAGLK